MNFLSALMIPFMSVGCINSGIVVAFAVVALYEHCLVVLFSMKFSTIRTIQSNITILTDDWTLKKIQFYIEEMKRERVELRKKQIINVARFI